MATAILVSGQMRQADRCFSSIKRHLLDRCGDYRLFVHTSRDADEQKAELFKPDRFTAAEPPRFNLKCYFMRTGRLCNDPAKTLAQLWRLQEVNRMRREFESETGEAFDRVIRLRPDTYFLNDFEGDAALADSTVHIPTFGNYLGYNDRFAFGRPGAMDHYLDKLYAPLDAHLARGGIFHPESILKGVLDHSPVSVARTPILFDTVRSESESLRPAWCGELGDEPPAWFARRRWRYRPVMFGYDLA